MGCPLFNLEGRQLVLNDVGKQIFIRAKSLLNAQENLRHSQVSSSVRVTNSAQSRSKAQPTGHLKSFTDHIESALLRNVLAFWQERGAASGSLTIEDLVNANLISRADGISMMFHEEDSEIRCMDATSNPTKYFGFDRSGFGIPIEKMWNTDGLIDARRKIVVTAKAAAAPVFYTGNGPIPWHSDHYQQTRDRFLTTRMDRLMLPVAIDKGGTAHARTGFLQVSEWQTHLNVSASFETLCAEDEASARRANVIESVLVGLDCL